MSRDAKVCDALTEPKLNAEVAILLRWAQAQPLERNGAEKESLGEMRPLVGQSRFGSDQNDLAGEAGVSQPRGDCVARGPAADNQGFRSSSRSRLSDQTR